MADATPVRHPLMPEDTPDYMLPAWLGCMHWAIGNPEVVDAFRAETGMSYQPPRTGLDAAIDKATGADTAFVEAFILWANIAIWGAMAGPEP